jgi:hypothetical protein
MSRTVWLVVPFLLAAPLCAVGEEAAPKQKPACDAKSRGKLWPEKGGRGADTPVEICAPKGWHYRWEQLTVDVSQLKADFQSKADFKAKEVATGLHTQSITQKRGTQPVSQP